MGFKDHKSNLHYDPLPFQEDALQSEDDNSLLSTLNRKRTTSFNIVLHISFVLLYTAIFFFLVRRDTHSSCRRYPDIVPSPAKEAIEYQRQTFHAELNAVNVYRGTPRPELDQAWQELIDGLNTRIPKTTLDDLGRTSIPLEDGSGDYYVTLDVFHQLHCLRKIRHYVTKDYYPGEVDFVPKPGEALPEHLDHCIDNLRQYIMCNADVSLITFEWIDNWPIPWPIFEVEHQCVNWEKLKEWASERAFPASLLHHPTLGQNRTMD